MENEPRLQATADEFERLLRGETIELSLEGWKSLCVLEDDEIVISNLLVEENINLTNKYPYNIYLIGNTFLRDFFISSEAQTGDFVIFGEAITGFFMIFDNVKTGHFRIFGEAQMEGFNIYGEAQTGVFAILGEARTFNFNIYGEAQTKSFVIFSKAQTGDFKISDKARTGGFKISEEAKTGDLQISGEAQTGDLQIFGKAKTGDLQISDKVKTGDLQIFGEANMGHLQISKHANLKTLYISGKIEMGTLSIRDKACFDQITIIDVQLGRVQFFGANLNGQLKILNSKYDQIEIKGDSSIKADKISIESTQVNILNFLNVQILETPVQISGVEPPKESKKTTYLQFTKSNFKTLDLINNKFDKFDFMVFEDSNITGSFISQTQFPEHIQSADPEAGRNPHEYPKVNEDKDQAKLFYEQIKTVYSKQGNRTEALQYQAKELDIHFANLRWTFHFWDKLFWDKITLGFHKYTTYFGTQWIRGFLFLIGSTTMLYTFTLWSTEKVTWTWPWLMRWEDFRVYYTHYIEFLNPTTNLLWRWEYIYELEGFKPNDTGKRLGSAVATWILLSKVVIVTLIYQIVQAFRKFGRS
ncbi:hypothetical protein QQ020_23855 [Fulvivirgaceae bacterium BMA12]|uniref:Membrane-associated oxidoreductase n=1 Tax=Agaribacillus aureus TaxID=3051825 RepID=A0ABT8LFK5_9BACT|nr:hypothetical protein [Fulvivirgaceae bacterium BMA12]